MSGSDEQSRLLLKKTFTGYRRCVLWFCFEDKNTGGDCVESYWENFANVVVFWGFQKISCR